MTVAWSAIEDEIQAIVKDTEWQTGATHASKIQDYANDIVEQIATDIDIREHRVSGVITATLNDYRYNMPATPEDDFLKLSKDPETFITASRISKPSQDTGSGLNDLAAGGNYHGTDSTRYYRVTFDSAGTPDTFKWETSTDNSSWTEEATGVEVTGDWQNLDNGVKIRFKATTGHTDTDVFTFNAVTTDFPIIHMVTADELNLRDEHHKETTTQANGPNYVALDGREILVQPKWAGDLMVHNYYRKPVRMSADTDTIDIVSDGVSGDNLIKNIVVAATSSRIFHQWLNSPKRAKEQADLAVGWLDDLKKKTQSRNISTHVEPAYPVR
jgi:hypothetical protein